MSTTDIRRARRSGSAIALALALAAILSLAALMAVPAIAATEVQQGAQALRDLQSGKASCG